MVTTAKIACIYITWGLQGDYMSTVCSIIASVVDVIATTKSSVVVVLLALILLVQLPVAGCGFCCVAAAAAAAHDDYDMMVKPSMAYGVLRCRDNRKYLLK